MGIHIALQGLAVTLITMAAYIIGHYMESGRWEFVTSPDGMTMAFLTLSLAEIFHSFNMRSLKHSIFRIKTKNRFLFGAMAVSWLTTTLVIYVPFLRNAFGFEYISLTEYAISIALALCIIPLVELAKFIQRRGKTETKRGKSRNKN